MKSKGLFSEGHHSITNSNNPSNSNSVSSSVEKDRQKTRNSDTTGGHKIQSINPVKKSNQKTKKKPNNFTFSDLYINANKMMINNPNKSLFIKDDDVASNHSHCKDKFNKSLEKKNNSILSNNMGLEVSKNQSEISINVIKKASTFQFEEANEKKMRHLSPKSREVIEKEYDLNEDVQGFIDQLGNLTVKYNETIINQINSQNELKVLKDTRNKLITEKTKMESQLDNDRAELDNLQRQTLNSLPSYSNNQKRYDPPIMGSMLLKRNSITNVSSITSEISKNLSKLKFNKMSNENLSNTQLELLNQAAQYGENELDGVVDDLELQISKLKQENQNFFEYVDELNDSTFVNEQENKRLLGQMKNLDKQILDMNKERNSVKKAFDKTFPELKDKIIYNDVNIDVLLKTNERNLSEDILNYMSNK